MTYLLNNSGKNGFERSAACSLDRAWVLHSAAGRCERCWQTWRLLYFPRCSGIDEMHPSLIHVRDVIRCNRIFLVLLIFFFLQAYEYLREMVSEATRTKVRTNTTRFHFLEVNARTTDCLLWQWEQIIRAIDPWKAYQSHLRNDVTRNEVNFSSYKNNWFLFRVLLPFTNGLCALFFWVR